MVISNDDCGIFSSNSSIISTSNSTQPATAARSTTTPTAINNNVSYSDDFRQRNVLFSLEQPPSPTVVVQSNPSSSSNTLMAVSDMLTQQKDNMSAATTDPDLKPDGVDLVELSTSLKNPTKIPCPIPTLKTTNALWKRVEQLRRWQNSETDRESDQPRNNQSSCKVSFQQPCVFLAACASGEKDEVLFLLGEQVNINTANADGMTALHQACIDGNLDMVQFLHLNGADINYQDNEGWSPLHAAASCGNLEITRYLVRAGADLTSCTSDRELPVDLADGANVEAYLQNEMAKQKIVDSVSCREAEHDCMRQHCNRLFVDGEQNNEDKENDRFILNFVDSRTGATALHVAAAKDYQDVVRMLLQAGLDPNCRDHDGWSPLHAAAHWDNLDVAKLLVHAGANVLATTNSGHQVCDVCDEDIWRSISELDSWIKMKSASGQSHHIPDTSTGVQSTNDRKDDNGNAESDFPEDGSEDGDDPITQSSSASDEAITNSEENATEDETIRHPTCAIDEKSPGPNADKTSQPTGKTSKLMSTRRSLRDVSTPAREMDLRLSEEQSKKNERFGRLQASLKSLSEKFKYSVHDIQPASLSIKSSSVSASSRKVVNHNSDDEREEHAVESSTSEGPTTSANGDRKFSLDSINQSHASVSFNPTAANSSPDKSSSSPLDMIPQKDFVASRRNRFEAVAKECAASVAASTSPRSFASPVRSEDEFPKKHSQILSNTSENIPNCSGSSFETIRSASFTHDSPKRTALSPWGSCVGSIQQQSLARFGRKSILPATAAVTPSTSASTCPIGDDRLPNLQSTSANKHIEGIWRQNSSPSTLKNISSGKPSQEGRAGSFDDQRLPIKNVDKSAGISINQPNIPVPRDSLKMTANGNFTSDRSDNFTTSKFSFRGSPVPTSEVTGRSTRAKQQAPKTAQSTNASKNSMFAGVTAVTVSSPPPLTVRANVSVSPSSSCSSTPPDCVSKHKRASVANQELDSVDNVHFDDSIMMKRRNLFNTPSKVESAEAERKKKSARARRERRSTQGVSASDVAQALTEVNESNNTNNPSARRSANRWIDQAVPEKCESNQLDSRGSNEVTANQAATRAKQIQISNGSNNQELLKMKNDYENDLTSQATNTMSNAANQVVKRKPRSIQRRPTGRISNSSQAQHDIDGSCGKENPVVQHARIQHKPTGEETIDSVKQTGPSKVDGEAQTSSFLVDSYPLQHYKLKFHDKCLENEQLQAEVEFLKRDVHEKDQLINKLKSTARTDMLDKRRFEAIKMDNVRLKEENAALIRVISKMSKQT